MKKSVNPLFIFAAIFLLPIFLFAAEGAHHEEVSIPYKMIMYQTLNFAVALGVVYFAARKKIGEFFKARGDQYFEHLRKAEDAKKAAQLQKQEISERLSKLEKSADQDIARARSEAAELKSKIIRDAEAIAKHLKVEAEKTAIVEVERAKNDLRTHLLEDSLKAAKKALADGVKDPDQKRLKTEFVEKIQAVK
jgi:F-type H+-transporting ATPase subunit b